MYRIKLFRESEVGKLSFPDASSELVLDWECMKLLRDQLAIARERTEPWQRSTLNRLMEEIDSVMP